MSSMSLTEILAEIPKLSFAERQELVRRAIEVEDQDLTAEEKAILEERLADFRRNPNSGIPGEQLKAEVLQRLNRR
jgi:putative addiction module component (TIGR02574 family)